MERELFLILNFLKERYKLKVYFANKKNRIRLGVYIKYFEEKKFNYELIKIYKKNLIIQAHKINISLKCLNYFILFHEVGHFLIEKSNVIQKEEYADYIALCLMREFGVVSKLELDKINNLLNEMNQKKNNEVILRLEELVTIFIYTYKKFYRD